MTKIIKQEGLGRYIKDLERDGGYFSYISFGLTNEVKYCVIHINPYIKNFDKCLYEGYDENKAEDIFNETIEKDKKFKQNLIYKIFSKN